MPTLNTAVEALQVFMVFKTLFVIHVASGCLKYLFYLTRKSLEITNFFSRENLVKRVPQYKTTPLPTHLFTAFFIYYYDFSKYVLSLHLYIN